LVFKGIIIVFKGIIMTLSPGPGNVMLSALPTELYVSSALPTKLYVSSALPTELYLFLAEH
jgi:hypothetical protein